MENRGEATGKIRSQAMLIQRSLDRSMVDGRKEQSGLPKMKWVARPGKRTSIAVLRLPRAKERNITEGPKGPPRPPARPVTRGLERPRGKGKGGEGGLEYSKGSRAASPAPRARLKGRRAALASARAEGNSRRSMPTAGCRSDRAGPERADHARGAPSGPAA